MRIVAIAPKIPDNTAYTALVALQRLGVPVIRVERSEILRLRAGEPEPDVNPNTQRLVELVEDQPRAGELWVQELDDRGARRATAWRLTGEDGKPAASAVLRAAAERLLCNPAIERFVI
jgi:phosphoribosylformylglycinamidine (FGAM) synthase PurS component